MIAIDLKVGEFKPGYVGKMNYYLTLLDRIEKALDEYYAEEGKKWENYDKTGIIIRISQIETRLLAINGIMDIADTTINGIAKNYQLSHDALPVRGTFTWSAN